MLIKWENRFLNGINQLDNSSFCISILTNISYISYLLNYLNNNMLYFIFVIQHYSFDFWKDNNFIYI